MKCADRHAVFLLQVQHIAHHAASICDCSASIAARFQVFSARASFDCATPVSKSNGGCKHRECSSVDISIRIGRLESTFFEGRPSKFRLSAQPSNDLSLDETQRKRAKHSRVARELEVVAHDKAMPVRYLHDVCQPLYSLIACSCPNQPVSFGQTSRVNPSRRNHRAFLLPFSPSGHPHR